MKASIKNWMISRVNQKYIVIALYVDDSVEVVTICNTLFEAKAQIYEMQGL